MNCAGLYSDEIARMVDKDSKIKIIPRKGEEYILNKKQKNLAHHIIFPLPTGTTKGTLIIPTVDETLMVGPTADSIEDKEDVTTTASGLKRVFEKA